MVNNSIEWLGEKFGRLTVVDFTRPPSPSRGWYWVCECECGTIKTLCPRDVRAGKVKSCGCLHDELASVRATKFKYSVSENKRLYSIYNGIKKRCYRESEPRYKDYGMRGIKMCDEWLNSENGFDNFVEWSLSHGYNDDLTIDRVDVNADYEPCNCRWVSLQTQQQNKRTTLWVEYKGERVQLRVLCKKHGLSYDTVHNRIYTLGWSVESAIDTSSQQSDSLRKKCIERGINYSTVRDRIFKLGWDEERALSTPSCNKKS